MVFYFQFVFTRATLASAGISLPVVVSCLSVRLSQVGVLLKRLNVRMITQTTPHDSPETVVFLKPKILSKRKLKLPTDAPNAGGVDQMQVR